MLRSELQIYLHICSLVPWMPQCTMLWLVDMALKDSLRLSILHQDPVQAMLKTITVDEVHQILFNGR